MQNKNCLHPKSGNSKWSRLLVSISLALGLTLVVMLIPISVATTIHIPAPLSSDGSTIDISLPFGTELVRATGGLTITKSVEPSTVIQGELLTYTLTISNDTGDNLTLVTVTDDVPDNTTCFDLKIPTGWVSNGPGNCAISGVAFWQLLPPTGSGIGGFIPDGSAISFIYVVRVDEPRPDLSVISNDAFSYEVEASVPATYTDIGTEDITATVFAPEWQISKVADSTVIQPADTLTYTLTITNSGHLTTTGSYTITDQLPEHTNYLAGSASNGGTFDGSNLTWVLSAPVGINESFTATFAVTVTRPLTDGISLINQTYSITGGNVFSQAFGSAVPVTVDAPVTMTITKSDAPFDPILAGDLLTYSLTITADESSKGHAENVVVTDTLPANTSFVDAGFAGATTGITVTDGSVITWTITSPDPLLVGESLGLTLTVRVDSPLPNGTVLTNTYGVTASNAPDIVAGTDITTTVVSTPVLEIFKQGFPQPVAAGELLTYTITYTNSGNADATGVVITDVFPISTTFSSESISGTVTTSGRQWDIGTVAGEGGTGVLTLTLLVNTPQDEGTVLTDVVTITAVEPASDTYTATNSIVSSPTLEIFKQGLPQPVQAGGLLTYTIQYTNTGNADANGAVVTDIFPAGTTFDSATPTGSSILGGAGREWTIGNVPGDNGGGFITLTLRVDSPQDNGTVLTDVVTITASDPTSDTYTATNTIVSTPTLEIFKQGLPQPVEAGGLLTYTIFYTNSGNADATGVVITDIFPISTTFSSESVSGTVTSSGRQWDIGTVAGEGGTGVITLTVLVEEPQDAGTVLTDVVTITALEPAEDTYTATNTITSTPVLAISKVESRDPIKAGEVLTYTITYTNTGNSDATGVIITDTYEGNFDSITATPPATVITSPLPARVRWDIGFLPADGIPRTKLVTVSLPISIPEGTIVTDTVTITSAQQVEASDTITTEIRALRADLQASKVRQGSGDVLAGDPISYTITITNGTGSDMVDAVLTDTFPIGAVQTVVDCTPACGSDLGNGKLTWTVSNLAADEVRNFTVELQTSPAFSNSFTNTVGITFTQDFVTAIDPAPDNNTDTVIDTVRFPIADLQASKVRQGSGDVISGDRITYTLTITNGTGSDAVNAVITDTFPAGAVQAVPNCSGCDSVDLAAGEVVWTVNNFAADDVQNFTLVLQTSPTYSNSFTNTVEIGFSPADPNALDPNPDNNTDSVIDTVRFPIADLQASKVRQGSGDVIAGDRITYTLTITNGTGSDTVTAVMTDTFPVGAVQTVVNCDGCTPNLAAGQLTWTISNFAADDVRNFTVVLQTAPTYANQFTNTVEIGFSSADPNGVDPEPDNNSDTVIDTVRPRQADLSIVKARVGSGVVLIGDPITFTLTVDNAGPDPVTAVVTDTFVNATILTHGTAYPGGFCSGAIGGPGPIFCTLPNLLGTAVITVVLDTTGSLDGDSVFNSVAVDSVEVAEDPDTDDRTDFVGPIILQGEARLAITKVSSPASGQSVRPGQTIVYDLQVTNLATATAAATNVFITDTLPLPSVGIVSVTTNGTDLGLSGNDYSFFTGTLGIGSSLNATIEVTVTADISGTVLSNSAIGSSTETGQIGPQVTSHLVTTDTTTLYLPIVMKNFAPKPDLIGSFSLNPPNPSAGEDVVITVVVTNSGNAATGDGFWVDFYINPDPVPTTGNQRWDSLGSTLPDPVRGIAWAIPSPGLAPGQSITLTSNGVGGRAPSARHTRWDDNFVNGTQDLYVFVDSFSLDGSTNGGILESNETNNRSELHFVSPLTGGSIDLSGQAEPAVIPPRYDP